MVIVSRGVGFISTGFLVLFTIFVGCRPSDSEPGGSADRVAKGSITILNVSYDPTRELYKEFNQQFAQDWQEKTGQKVSASASHGGSGKQLRKVIDGLEADVVTLALAYDIDTIVKSGQLVAADWQKRLPYNSAPYTSTIVFLVRKGNPKAIKDWGDLVKPGVSIVTPHPKTSGGARWNYLAAWGFALKRELGDLAKLHDPKQAEAVAQAQAKARAFVADVFSSRRVAKYDSGARDATMTFVQRGMGDVLLAWENEAFLAVGENAGDQVEIVVPSVSILAEPSVAVVDKVVDKRGTRQVAEAYLQHLYSPAGQALAAKHHYRPRKTEGVPVEYLKAFPKLDLFTIDDVFGGWKKAQPEHFDDGGVFDSIYKPGS
jgi:sulfate/thiosulfate transport system substrate-binding protein